VNSNTRDGVEHCPTRAPLGYPRIANVPGLRQVREATFAAILCNHMCEYRY
jgi:hypothetical protein